MDIFEQKFAVFVEVLKKNTELKLTWNDQLVNALKAALKSAQFDQVITTSIGGYTKPKRVNGYNLFMKERMAQLKETGVDSNSRMKQISDEWNKLEEDKKNEWKEKAAAAQPKKLQIKLKKPVKPVKWSGYQMFVSEKMAEIKDKVEPKQRMTEIGKLWQQQTEEQKNVYKAKATAKNEAANVEVAPVAETK